nr:WhiB family transcriptional regulator [Streptomyces boncukensis]
MRAILARNTAPSTADAACAGTATESFHPEQGPPGDEALALCARCPVRLACLALALRTEDPVHREGWYGGLGPAERDALARRLRDQLAPSPPVPEEAATAYRMRREGASVGTIAAALGRCTRTVQRYVRTVESRAPRGARRTPP